MSDSERFTITYTRRHDGAFMHETTPLSEGEAKYRSVNLRLWNRAVPGSVRIVPIQLVEESDNETTAIPA